MVSKSINYWSYPGGMDNSLPVSDFLNSAKSQGYDAVELCIGETGVLGLGTTVEECAAIKCEADSIGLPIKSVASGIYWSYSLADADPGNRKKAVEALQQMIEMTAALGAKTLLTIPGAVDVFFIPDRPELPYDFVWQHATKGLERVLPLAEKRNIVLGIENVWNKFLLSPMEMATFIDQFKSPAIGAYVDVANILPYGYPEHWLRVLGKRVAGIHFKDFRRAVGTIEGFVDLLEGDVNWPEVMKAIGEIGYDGPVVAEMIPLYTHYPEVRTANTSRAMDSILGRG
jgi:L-ribulose-5-phosphate 3-epimerase